MSDLRDKIARALFDYTVKAYQVPDSDMLHPVDFRNEADAVLAVIDLDKVRAEAQVKALREAADPFQNVTGSDTPVFSPATADYLHARADRIACEAGIVSEGTTTGESNE